MGNADINDGPIVVDQLSLDYVQTFVHVKGHDLLEFKVKSKV